jgi:hypothetical protein
MEVGGMGEDIMADIMVGIVEDTMAGGDTTVGTIADTMAGAEVIIHIGGYGDGDFGDGLFWGGPMLVGPTMIMEGTLI